MASSKGGKDSKPKFTIDDAFEPEDDDAIRTYGATTESTPLKPKTRGPSSSHHQAADPSGFAVRIEDPAVAKPTRLSRLKVPEHDALSKDSDSLIHSDIYSAEKYDAKKSWWKHPKVRENWRVMLAAFGLLIIGLGLLVTGVAVQIIPEIGVQSFVFFIAGAICFIPGAYHVVYVYCAVKGRRGYDFYNLPLFN